MTNYKEIKKTNGLMGKIVRVSLAEFIGTFVLVLAGCGAIAMSQMDSVKIGHMEISAAFGLAVMCMIYAVGHISGAHFNPAVTISFAINRGFHRELVIPYLLAQCLGAITACLMLYYTLLPMVNAHVPPVPLDIGVTLPFTGSIWAALLWEFVLTFMLMFVITSVATDARAVGELAGLAIGGTVFLAALVGGDITGASMNPARSLGPALISGQWQYFYIYVFGPILGATAGGYVYGLLCPDCEQCRKKFSIL